MPMPVRPRGAAALLRRHAGLVVVLAAGAALRLVLVLSYDPAYLTHPDSWGYAKAAAGPLFIDNWIRPAGYPAFLAGLHAVSGSLHVAVIAQHLLGLTTAVVLYATMLRAGASRWLALVPAAVVALTLDAIVLEHALMSEGLFTLLIALVLYTGVRALEPGAGLGWAPACGALIALCVTVRGLALFAVPVVVLVMLLRDGTLRRRLAGAAVTGAAAAAVLIAYMTLQYSQIGYFGLTEGSGWAMYSRTAQFADCRVFTPPEGTAGLCDPRDARTRPGPDWYAWAQESPGHAEFGGPPWESQKVGAFGRAAIMAQPKAYATTVATDLWRYLDPDAGPDRISNGEEPKSLDVATRYPGLEQVNFTQIDRLYGPTRVELSGSVSTLSDIQRVVRVHGVLIGLALVLALAGIVLARGTRRAVILLLTAVTVVPIVLATATTIYGWRYLVPLLPSLAGAAVLGAQCIAARVAQPRRTRQC